MLFSTYNTAFSQDVNTNNYFYGYLIPDALNQGVWDNAPVGQSFMVGTTGYLSQIGGIYAWQVLGGGNFKLTLYQGEGYQGTIIATQLFNAVSDVDFNINLNPLPQVQAGNKYTFKIESVPGTGSSMELYIQQSTYTDGDIYFGANGSYVYGDYDMSFATYVQVPSSATHLNFDGVDDYVDCGANSIFNISTNLTIEGWVYPTA
ncbi:hypothetical protein [Flavobacterium sp.]|uniref:hypothetical protein n=1 Tax=Flavobacterium sp. TaxID=239 RepID=UPI003529A650